MKKSIVFLLLLAFGTTVLAQTTDVKKRPSLALSLSFKDFKTPELLKSKSLSGVLADKQFSKLADMTPGLALQYFQGLTDNIDVMGTLDGSYLNYPFATGTRFNYEKKLLISADINVNIKLLNDSYTLVPYLTAGIGASMYNGSYFAANTPLGGGLQIKLAEGTFLNTQMIYKVKTTDLATNHLYYTFGLTTPLTEKKVAKLVSLPAPVKAVEKDSDNDGIVDSKDKCPTVAGTAKYDGCPVPDTDGDGINDEADKCPTVKGLAKYNGCPVPDTDKDGINDEEDKCPTVAGLARYNGCPAPDADKDGVIDEEDKCPNEPGTAANKGCPEVQKQVAELAKSVYFTTNSAEIGGEAAKTLDAVADILNKYSTTLAIEGHTDNVGKVAANKTLSQKRANAIKKYLVNKGVAADKITATGFGSEKPIADNATYEGRSKNRRVELKANYTF